MATVLGQDDPGGWRWAQGEEGTTGPLLGAHMGKVALSKAPHVEGWRGGPDQCIEAHGVLSTMLSWACLRAICRAGQAKLMVCVCLWLEMNNGAWVDWWLPPGHSHWGLKGQCFPAPLTQTPG